VQRERAEVRRCLREKEHLAAQYFDGAGVLMLALDTRGIVTMVNTYGISLYGREDLREYPFSRLRLWPHGDELETALMAILQIPRHGQQRTPTASTCPSGKAPTLLGTWWQLTVQTVTLSGVRCSATDVSAQPGLCHAARAGTHTFMRCSNRSRIGVYIINARLLHRLCETSPCVLFRPPETSSARIPHERTHPARNAPTKRCLEGRLSRVRAPMNA
jgi:hypothetical protein